MRTPLAVALSGLVLLGACASRGPQRVGTEPTVPRDEGWVEKGDASWYGEPYHGRQTASGETYDMHELTAAHRSLPFGTMVEVTRRDTGADVTVRINDRGPFIAGRIIDLSYGAAKRIGLHIDGVAPVRLKVVAAPGERTDRPRRPAPVEPGTTACLWVQVGAFSDPDNARRAVDRLKSEGFKALAMEGPDGLQRVRVGPFDDDRETEEALANLLPDWPAARKVNCG